MSIADHDVSIGVQLRVRHVLRAVRLLGLDAEPVGREQITALAALEVVVALVLQRELDSPLPPTLLRPTP